jgi:hypothetical protein
VLRAVKLAGVLPRLRSFGSLCLLRDLTNRATANRLLFARNYFGYTVGKPFLYFLSGKFSILGKIFNFY